MALLREFVGQPRRPVARADARGRLTALELGFAAPHGRRVRPDVRAVAGRSTRFFFEDFFERPRNLSSLF
jgi:hypothetical protein